LAERLVGMKRLAIGVWSTAHWSLDRIGRAATGHFPTKTLSSEDEACSITGGAIVGAIFGVLLGFALSDELQATTTLARAAIGGLLGLCVGVMLGAVIQTVDDAIDEWLNSLNSK
jgi:hypothetical protein